ncbi:efflux RND transporter periplasmic adaptor subunit [Ideonella alba]|uniref:Efflux RND transporter periplasmic adaptor subunit n=1 Tax=Ideonella alba TaxID=2824118 RepID=A0A941BBF4_9BURK|nr:efflux RND transporter periplasmic adaptor subunit [Ideonella alba]MBQ0930810.1 efflux RND transporter periplasmic adaptor subunit [Ideonella alba]
MGIKNTAVPSRLRRRLLPALGLGLTGLLTGAAIAATPVPVIQLSAASAGRSLEMSATIEALRQATVAAQASGNVLALGVKAGDRVKAGQWLARIDDREPAAALSRSEGGVLQAEAELRNAQVQAERTRDLRAKGFVSQAALDVAETQLKSAQAGLQAAQGGRRQAALARDFSTITAPFDGVVLATHLDTGDLAAPGRPILTLYAPGALRAVVQVPASRSAAARQASGRQVQLPDGQWVTPLRSTELPTTDPVSQTVEWRLDLPASAQATPGQSVSVRFDGAPTEPTTRALLIPAAAVLQRGELEAVYVLRDQRFVLRAVRLGSRQGQQVEVLAGLKAGEQIAADAVRAGLADATPAAR